MGPALYLIAILGCGEADAPCEQLRVPAARYRNRAACNAATAAELERHADLAFPAVVAQCRPAGARPALLRGVDVLRPEPSAADRPRFAAAAAAPVRSSR